MKQEINWVYCPKCGEVSDASLLYCEHCKESLIGAIKLDPDESKIKKRREQKLKRVKRRQAIKAKKEALFEKAPILKPLYYIFWVLFIIGLLAGIIQIFKVSTIAGLSLATVAFIRFYIWYVPIIIDNIDSFDFYTDQLPSAAGSHERVLIHRIMWGLVINGGFLIICLLGLIFSLLME